MECLCRDLLRRKKERSVRNQTRSLAHRKISYCFVSFTGGEEWSGIDDEDVMAFIATKWAALSPEEKETVAGPRAEEIQEDRETRLVGTHNCEVKAFHDVSATLSKVEKIVSETQL